MAEDAIVAVSVVVMWSVAAFAKLWHVVAVVPSTRSVLSSPLWAAVVQSDRGVLVIHVPVLESRSSGNRSHHHFSLFHSQEVMPSELVLPHTWSRLLNVKPKDCCLKHQMTLAGPVQWPCD